MDAFIKHRFWVETKEGKFLGDGRIELLELIEKLGSINKAAAEMKMAYRKAWGLCQSMNEHSSRPLIIQQTGGKRGGGTQVTEDGKRAIKVYRELQKNFEMYTASQSDLLKTL